MDLNDIQQFKVIDRENMIGHVDGLPSQLLEAWNLGLAIKLPVFPEIHRVVISGMGGSAIGADLVAAFLADQLKVPLIIHRDYGLPAFALGKDTLVVISSHSGNTEEPLSSLEKAIEQDCSVVSMCTGGKLLERSEKAGIPVMIFKHVGQPRSAVGFSFGLLLALLFRIGLISDPTREIENAVGEMNRFQAHLRTDVVVLNNPAKRLAGQMIGKHITIFGSSFLAPVARRWKTQLNEVAKVVASFEFLPEADHNTLAGICNPVDMLSHELAIFLKASSDDPKNQLRIDHTREIMMLEGLSTDFLNAKGTTRLEQMWTAILFGDYVAYYLAMAYGVDPTPIPAILELKDRMSQ